MKENAFASEKKVVRTVEEAIADQPRGLPRRRVRNGEDDIMVFGGAEGKGDDGGAEERVTKWRVSRQDLGGED